MDQKGTLVNTKLKIYPTEELVCFLRNLSEEDIPDNILKVIGKGDDLHQDTFNSDSSNIQFTTEELRKLEKITDIINECKPKLQEETPEQEATNITNGHTNIESVEEDIVEKEQEVKKTPFRNTSDLEWEEDEETPEEVTQVEEIIQQIPFLTTPDIDWLYNYLQNKKSNNIDVPYLHELLSGANIEMPDNTIIKRNPVLEARCVKLRKQQEAREYRKMTKTVDNVRMRFPEDSIAYQMKQLNRQLIAIGQFIISIFAGFLFGFRGVEWLVGNLDFGFRLLLGVMCALVIALAEIYFLAKKLNEELNIPETVQLGGPPKFVDEKTYMNSVPTKKAIEKLHQD